MKLENTLKASDFTSSPYAAEALHRLNIGDWSGFELRDLRYAFDALEAARQHRNRNNKLKPAAPEWSELRTCLHALANVFASKWLEQGKDMFSKKLDFYCKARRDRVQPTDELFYQALVRLNDVRGR